ncbi:Aspyridones efflux protein apdF [Psilocybe cubensis]|uniref:Aspyridones efflux protein apdF n=2 Tax=Psilocybe cubensis TaxID=181762 RepID=A0ACB8GI30_PSICU|nr:Aspyridones efflux protein apdF [Psilocybe cubensis]KAH9474724.1 Aspyridones efflux protein apdF [Psilocybe cubensis]
MVCTAATIFSVLGVRSSATLIVVSVMYRFFSGAWLSVSMAALASLSRSPQEVGARIGLALALSSAAGSLVSTPIQGALLGSEFRWSRPAIFSGVFMLISVAFNLVTRVLLAKERGTQKV